MLPSSKFPPGGSMLTRMLGYALSPGGSRARLVILTYHRVLPTHDPLNSNIDIADFALQVGLLVSQFNVLGLSEAIEALRNHRLPPRSVCLTFDDGYLDNVENALPILLNYGVPATFFVSTGFLDGGCMWNDIVKEAIRRASAPVLDVRDLGLGAHRVANTAERVRAAHMLVNAIKYLEPCKRRDYAEQISARASAELPREFMMRAEHVRRLATAGMEVGAHTVNHPILTSVDEDTAMSEISSGKATIEKIIGRPVRFFAYPNGMPKRDFTLRHVEMVKSLGFAAAVTTSSGAASPCSDLFQLPRFGPWDREPVRFVVRLLQCYRRAGAVA